ncbi:MAG: hypothetical protein LBT89_04260 [Planctomycetaceae bacterium]|jgi:hypothetical protein|nr:hypothetical protein [Planctomycetaceae bacterium]
MKKSVSRLLACIVTAAMLISTVASPLFAQQPSRGSRSDSSRQNTRQNNPPQRQQQSARQNNPPQRQQQSARQSNPPQRQQQSARQSNPPQRQNRGGGNDLEKTLAIIGATAAIVNGVSRYNSYRRERPVVVVPAQPSTVVIEYPVTVDETVAVDDSPVLVESTPYRPRGRYLRSRVQ